jgi:hypothetical protein
MCCGPNEIGDGQGNCVCKPTFTLGPITKKCLCSPYNKIENGTCVCSNGFVRNATGSCICATGDILKDGVCQCNTTKGFVRNPMTHVCGCPPYMSLVNDKCECVEGFVWNVTSKLCEPTGGQFCEVQKSTVNCSSLIPYRTQNVADAVQNLFGR